MTIRRTLSSDKPHHERVSCYKPTAEHAERRHVVSKAVDSRQCRAKSEAPRANSRGASKRASTAPPRAGVSPPHSRDVRSVEERTVSHRKFQSMGPSAYADRGSVRRAGGGGALAMRRDAVLAGVAAISAAEITTDRPQAARALLAGSDVASRRAEPH